MIDRLLAAALTLAVHVTEPGVFGGDKGPERDAREGLFDRQLEVFECTAPVFYLLCSRRAGKTVGLCPRICHAARENPRSFNPYISITKLHARFMVWPTLKAVGESLGGVANNQLLTITFPNGGVVALGGMDNLKEVEKLRGGATSFAVVDECGTADPILLEYIHLEVLGPATLDYGGQIAFAGTPGQFMVGWWYEKTKDHRDHAAPVFKWTLRDNPQLPVVARGEKTHQQVLDEVVVANEWPVDEDGVCHEPKYLREYEGKWAEDPTGKVYPLSAINFVDELPTETPLGFPLERSKWRVVVGGDDGYDPDPLAFVVTMTHPDIAYEYITSSERHPRLLSQDAAARLREIKADHKGYGHFEIVWDFGGMGKRHAAELTVRHGIAIEAADKAHKESAVAVLSDNVKTGRTKVLTGPQNDALRTEWASLQWCPEAAKKQKRLPKDGNDHCSDAALYAMRRHHHYTKDHTPAKDLSPDAVAAEIRNKRMAAARARRNRVRPEWDA